MTVAILCALALHKAAEWQVNPNNTLIWDGKPYLPVGLCISPSETMIAKVSASGVQDVVVKMPADGKDWAKCFELLDKSGLKYSVQITSKPQTNESVTIDPAGYRVPDVSRKTNVDLAVGNASEALLILAAQRDGTVRWSKRVPVINGRIQETIDPLVELPHVLLVYPLGRSEDTTDFYEGLDDHRDRLLTAFQKSPPGQGFRGLIDPLGLGTKFPDTSTTVIPVSQMFHSELASFLETKYSGLSTALKAWGVATNDIKDFDQLARTVPLWSETRGVANLWDTANERLYTVDRKSSLAWQDIRGVMRNVASRRTKTLIENLRTTIHAPVISTWTGWDGPYTSADAMVDGVNFTTSLKSIPALLDGAARPIASVLKSASPVVAIASGLVPKPGEVSVEDSVLELESLGARGIYFETEDTALWATVAKLAKERQSDTSSSEWKARALFYPEAANDPASPGKLTGGLLWLPSRSTGKRLDYSGNIEGYQDESGYVLWSTDEPRKLLFRVTDPKLVTVTDFQGSPIPFKKKKEEIELELPITPTIFRGIQEAPVPIASMLETSSALTLLIDNFDSLVNVGGAEQYNLADTVKSFDRNPGTSYMNLRAQLARIAPRVAPFIWISASKSLKHNFGDVAPATGSASENALLLSNRFHPAGDLFFAEFPLSPHRPGTHEVWIAARLPAESRDKVRLRVGDRLLGPPAPPVSLYGDGFGWYKFGEVELQKGPTLFRFEVPFQGPSNIALDIVNLAQPGFRPRGPRMPLEWLRDLKPVKKGKG